jgi:hypothetical protein
VVLRPDRPLARWVLPAWELLAPRLPGWVIRSLARMMLRLPLGSRPRRRCVLAVSELAWHATARNRPELVLPMWDPDCEWRWDATFSGLGFDHVYRGHEGVRRSLEKWNEIWAERSFVVREVVDGGRTLVLRMTVYGRGALSGVPTEGEASSVVRLDPLIVYFHNFFHDADALRAAGFGGGRPHG